VLVPREWEHCQWIDGFRADPGMPGGSVLPPSPVLAPGSPLGSRTRISRSSAQVGSIYLKGRIRAYRLAPNHVHLIAVPQSADAPRRVIGEVHRRFTRMVNFREGWRGHLWQGWLASFVLDERRC